jgi:4-alpha-glucanotransferase
MSYTRGSGILLHLSSLPGRFGIGDLGQTSYDFIDFLARAKQHYWQFLALGPTNPDLDNSPYMSRSAFAGNPLLISPDLLLQDGFINDSLLEELPEFSEYMADFGSVTTFKEQILTAAFDRFRQIEPAGGFDDFCKREGAWLDDYALFMSLCEVFDNRPWYEWPGDIARREPAALQDWSRRLTQRILYHQFVQFCFYEQWQRLHSRAEAADVKLIGDLPFYVGLDSADVWAHQDIFKLHPVTRQPTKIAGVPPDYFSTTGQHWGNPVYRWKIGGDKPNQPLYDWWLRRLRHIFAMVDLVRIDHFRGFEASWQIPADEETAVNGRWVKGPGSSFFKKIQKKTGPLAIIAEDLGHITPAVEKMLLDLKYPGMKVLLFAFDSDSANPYLPHNYQTTNCVVYTGTHDNNTALGWYTSPEIDEKSKERARHYVNSSDNSQFHWDLIRLAFATVAALAIIPLQDILGLGGDCRMNVPSTCCGNWRWRCGADMLTDEVAGRLAAETAFFHRG